MNRFLILAAIGVVSATLQSNRLDGDAEMPTTAIKPSAKYSRLIDHGPAENGLAAFVICEERRYKAGDPIPLLYGVMNVGKETLDVWPVRPPTSQGNCSWLSVERADGVECPWRGWNPEWPGFVDRSSAVRLPPGGFLGGVSINLGTLYYDLKRKPAEYVIKWNYKVRGVTGPWQGQLTSNEVRIHVVD